MNSIKEKGREAINEFSEFMKYQEESQKLDKVGKQEFILKFKEYDDIISSIHQAIEKLEKSREEFRQKIGWVKASNNDSSSETPSKA